MSLNPRALKKTIEIQISTHTALNQHHVFILELREKQREKPVFP